VQYSTLLKQETKQ